MTLTATQSQVFFAGAEHALWLVTRARSLRAGPARDSQKLCDLEPGAVREPTA
eukprot:COSAG01_NODE_4956_length_4590_cov_7.535070_3_plen_53_part_00